MDEQGAPVPRAVDRERTDEPSCRQNRERTPALPSNEVRVREQDHRLLIYEPEHRDAYIESDTWQEVER
jgi:hypothetical protein